MIDLNNITYIYIYTYIYNDASIIVALGIRVSHKRMGNTLL